MGSLLRGLRARLAPSAVRVMLPALLVLSLIAVPAGAESVVEYYHWTRSATSGR